MELRPDASRSSPAHRAAAAPPAGGLSPAQTATLRRAAADFESFLIRDVIKTMRQSPTSRKGLLGGFGRGFYQDLMDDELAKALARRGGLGLADVLVRGMNPAVTPARNPSSSGAGQPINNPSPTPPDQEHP